MDINEALEEFIYEEELDEGHSAFQAKQAMTYHSAREKYHEKSAEEYTNPGEEGKLKFHKDRAEKHGKAWNAAYKISMKKYDDARNEKDTAIKKRTIKEMRNSIKTEIVEDIGHDGLELPDGMSADTWEVYKVLFSGIQDGSLTEEKLEQIEFVLEDTDIDLGNLLELSINTLKSYHDKADDDWKSELKKKNDGDYPKAFKRFAGKEKARLRINGTTPKQLNKLKNKKFSVNEAVKDMSKHENSDFHKVLTKHGFQYHSTNFIDHKNKENSRFQHTYGHPDHEKDKVQVWHWGSGDKSYHGRHKQKSNDILAPSTGDTKGQLDRTLTRHYAEKQNT